ncbi:pentapeptide repeat-containing protein [Streptomyces griseorubiginosus]|uniref:pentapeptide repeat-containing protein n=1 Tax=Streptomyces griseorubiginosus TaxID=67304 RepID=UPI0015E830F9|nr:pentapeptide repeat-containing protein [Streptomyces griseorubiginosus]
MFRGRDLRGQDFSGRYLVGADFSGADCRGCDFSGSDLSLAKFADADLYKAKFVGSVLYVTEFGSANLTRADLNGAFVYGFLFSSPSVITYASLQNFAVEERRRSTLFKPDNESEYEKRKFGRRIPDPGVLSRSNYRVNGNCFSFREPDDRETSLQRAQIFNILKRLYRENHDGRAALECHFWSRYHLTRSRYRRSVLTAQLQDDELPVGRLHTAVSYLAEFVSGYGVRPRRMVRSLALLFVVFFLVTWMLVGEATGSGVTYQGSVADVGKDVGSGGADLLRLAQFAALSLVSPQLNQFSPYGWMIPLSLLYFALSACLLALLFSSLFVMILSE